MIERKQSVSHSFGAKTSATGACSWFHFLCKNIDIKTDEKGRFRISQDRTYTSDPNVDEDYAYLKSGFVINTCTMRGTSSSNDDAPSSSSTTLVCFGATPHVRTRLSEFTVSGDKELAVSRPYQLFVPILSGLYLDLDEMAWKLNDVFAEYELVSSNPDEVSTRKCSQLKLTYPETLHRRIRHRKVDQRRRRHLRISPLLCEILLRAHRNRQLSQASHRKHQVSTQHITPYMYMYMQ
jgi:hypothetical protein